MYLTQTLHRALQQEPDRPLTIFGDRVRTVAESAGRVARLAGALRGIGVGDDEPVGILALNSDRFHEYLLAVPWANAVLNPINIRWSPAEICYSLEESGTKVLLVDDTFAPMVPKLRAGYAGLTTVVHLGDGPAPDGMLSFEGLIAEAEPVEDARRGGDALLGLYYTGGTTGTPKGVMLSHRNLFVSALGSLATGEFIGVGGRLLHAAPMFHLADGASWMSGQLVGATHVMVPTFTPAGVLAAIATQGVTDMLLVPTMVQLLVDHPDVGDYDLSGMRHVVYGASPISEAVLERARKVFTSAGFTQAYGMTELSPVATLLVPADHDDPALRRAAGRAAPHAEVRIVDPEDNEVPRGAVGEVVCRGEHVMLGYWNRPQETETALRGGWMHTGDGGYMDERGYVFVVDRIKDMIVSGGENVYSAEVENVLSRHPAVATCAVIGVPDERWGERVHAVVVLADGASVTGASVTGDELRAFCREHIAGYKAPRSVEFVDALPMSGAGKILKRELRRPYWDGAERRVH
ncbi:long-chain-fatty-acid--CoA ligase [Actinophytocola sp.]|jgi:acyl-CoA synthetase (AMP-forming)/AMP-acid ligase II|uniref:long-chain-fatty-acid--CoA ligase n=1 Tax=Actinophytocola sp. TaxID=1872138 RepID=UPI002EDA88E2